MIRRDRFGKAMPGEYLGWIGVGLGCVALLCMIVVVAYW
jgi:hypothetical protein